VRLRRHLDLDRGIGIGLGILLGIGVVVVFVFFGSEGTIDAPRISGVDTGKPPLRATHGRRPPLVVVRGGAPPPSGPAQLRFRQGSPLRFRVDSDIPIGIEIPGLGVSRSLGSGTSILTLTRVRPGQFPVIVAASHIAIATLRISRPRR
jgi:hypothetical protein